MSKPTWSAEEYARFAAENVLGWWSTEDAPGCWFGDYGGCWIADITGCKGEENPFNPRNDWRSAGPVLEALMGWPYNASIMHSDSAAPEYELSSRAPAYEADGDDMNVIVYADTPLEAIECFCWELHQMEADK